MGKFRLHKNVKRKGGSAATVKNTTVQKKPARLRKIGDGYGSWITDNWKNMIAYMFIWAIFLYALKFIIQ